MRLPFIDNIRWSMIILVLSMHASDTYSPFGNWYYTDRAPLSLGGQVFFATYQSFLQGFFMALLFFIAAYFTPASYDHKGASRYVRDRFTRLMVPTLLYIFVVGPLTEYYVSRSWTGGGGFIHQWLEHIRDGEWLSGTGPMWFCAVLFGFSVLYAGVRLASTRHTDQSTGDPSITAPSSTGPSTSTVVGFIVCMTLASFLVRIFIRSGHSVLNIQPADLPQYVLMFTAGIIAARNKWFENPPPRNARPIVTSTLTLSVVIWIFIVGWAVAFPDDTRKFGGGLKALSALRCLWETLVCVGMSYLLVMVFQRHFNRQGPAARFLSANAFAVYLFHPPILIACAIMLHGVTVPGPLKAGLLTVVSAVAVFTLCELVMRRIPYLREVL